jgi:serine phosphatase RsbU (regulator of sigma subunit)
VPARTVGGDFYDWQAGLDGTLNLTLGDVMGKGMPAALLMATVRAALRAVAGSEGPVGSVSRAQAALEADLERAGSYLTLFHATYDAASHCLSFVDAGHGHVFVRRAGGDAEPLEPRGLPVGLSFGLDYDEGMVALAPGDALILYSDGLVDAGRNGPLDRAAIAAALEDALDAPAMLERLIGLAGPLDALPDDLTVVVLRRGV